MQYKKLLAVLLLSFLCAGAHAQNWIKDYFYPADSLWSAFTQPTLTSTLGFGSLVGQNYNSLNVTDSSWHVMSRLVKLNDAGDTVWTRRNALLVTTMAYGDTACATEMGIGPTMVLSFNGWAQSVIRLPISGNYLVAGIDNGMAALVIAKYDALGNLLSSYGITPNIYTDNLKLVNADGDNFYCLFSGNAIYLPAASTGTTDTAILFGRVIKMNSTYSTLWSKTYTLHANVGTLSSIDNDPIDVFDAKGTADHGLIFKIAYDSAQFSYSGSGASQSKQFLKKLNADGTDAWQFSLQNAIADAASYNGNIRCLFTNSDSSSIIFGGLGELPLYTGPDKCYLFKLDNHGNIVDTFRVLSYLSFNPWVGVQLTNGNYLFPSGSGTAVIYSLFDNHLNYLYSVPSPFSENNYGVDGTYDMFGNAQGGAYQVFEADWSGHSTHLIGINCDSLFNCYPAFISGDISQDNNFDCTYNTGDLRIGGSVAKMHEATSGSDYYGIANGAGHYVANVPLGTFAATHLAPGFEANECGGPYSLPVTTATTTPNINFYDTLHTNIRDLQVWLTSLCLIPGDTTHLYGGAYNAGSTTATTTMKVVLDPGTTYLSAVPTPLSVTGDTVIFPINLLSDSGMFFDITIVESTSAVAGTMQTFVASSPFIDNLVATDDYAVYNRLVTSSYDPNYKSANRPLYYHKEDALIYSVQFQNTGSARARDVAVLDSLDGNLDPGTFKLLGSPEHTPLPTVRWMPNNRLLFEFKDIYLPDSATNPQGSHGMFTFSIKAKTSVAIGDTIHNFASIFFDYNSAIITDTTTNIIGSPTTMGLSNATPSGADVSLYPNPSTGLVTLQLPQGAGSWQVTVSDVSGREVSSNVYSSATINLNLDVQTGIYFVKVTNSLTRESVVRKLVVNR